MPGLTRPQQAAAVALTAAACCGLLSACSTARPASVAASPDISATEEAVFWEPDAEQEQMLLDCAGEKIGYAFVRDDVVSPDMSDGEGIIDTEEEWEGRRMIRAYSQCWIENYPGGFDRDSGFDADLKYRSAYGIYWGEDEPRGDALAPWPGKGASDGVDGCHRETCAARGTQGRAGAGGAGGVRSRW